MEKGLQKYHKQNWTLVHTKYLVYYIFAKGKDVSYSLARKV